MSKAKKSKSDSPRRPVDPERAARLRRVWFNLAGVVVLAVVLGAGFFATRRYVEREIVFPAKPPAVVLKNRPAWMTDFLAKQIAAGVRPNGAHSAFDHQMLVDVTAQLRTNPWIRKVNQVRRVYGNKPGDTLEIDCEYRAPVALVQAGGAYWLVDRQGVKLPEQFGPSDVPKIVIGPDRRTNIRIVEGVRRPAPKAGHKWGGDDLAAGLDMVELLYAKPFAEEIYKVNVSNVGGRKDPKEAHVVLVTKYNTAVRWGRPPEAADDFIEVKVARKLEYLRGVYEEFGRVDAKQPWIDIRYDKITYPSAAPADGAAHAASTDHTP